MKVLILISLLAVADAPASQVVPPLVAAPTTNISGAQLDLAKLVADTALQVEVAQQSLAEANAACIRAVEASESFKTAKADFDSKAAKLEQARAASDWPARMEAGKDFVAARGVLEQLRKEAISKDVRIQSAESELRDATAASEAAVQQKRKADAEAAAQEQRLRAAKKVTKGMSLERISKLWGVPEKTLTEDGIRILTWSEYAFVEVEDHVQGGGSFQQVVGGTFAPSVSSPPRVKTLTRRLTVWLKDDVAVRVSDETYNRGKSK